MGGAGGRVQKNRKNREGKGKIREKKENEDGSFTVPLQAAAAGRAGYAPTSHYRSLPHL